MTLRSNDRERHDLPARVMVGRVRRAHGLAGEVAVEILSDVADRFAVGRELWLARPASRNQRPASGSQRLTGGGAERRAERVRIVSSRQHKDGALMRFEGYGDRNAAETLHGSVLEVGRDEVPPAEEGSWYWFELTGCCCFDEALGEIGTVVDVVEDGGGLLLELKAEGKRLLVPFVRAFLVQVDTEAGRIDLRLPEGLVETCTSRS